MDEQSQPVEARKFILASPEAPLTQQEVRSFVLRHTFPPPWGPAMEQALREGLTAAGCRVSRCSCMETHRVVILRFKRNDAGQRDTAAIRRLLRTIVRELGSNISSSGLNCTVRQGSVEAELVLTEPAV
jgi:hypothetical protein